MVTDTPSKERHIKGIEADGYYVRIPADTGHHPGLIPDGIPEFSDSIPGKPDTGIVGWQRGSG